MIRLLAFSLAFAVPAMSLQPTVLAQSPSDGVDQPPSDGVGQLGVPIHWIDVPDTPDSYFMAQRSRDGRLYLTPNEAFFPKRGLVAAGTGRSKDIHNLNGGKSFATIEKWQEGDVAEWGLFLQNTGTLQARIWTTSSEANGKYTLQFGETTRSVSTTASVGKPALAATITFRVDKPGQQRLQLRCERHVPDTALHWIELSGEAIRDGAVLRKRWRPAAAHTKFSSSQTTEKIRLWVMEMDAAPGELGFYCPITTPFGYYGPTWRADGKVNTGFNFSLWSFGRGKPAPPVEQLSHLLAIGNRDAHFGGFDHEGTGVKIRNWEPLAGRQGQRQALALRVEPGETYDTYFSYFYAVDEQRWRFFGAGNKYNKGKPLDSLWVGSFVEVPGPPHIQRTGPYPRTMRYRGWVMDANGSWNQLDRMSHGNTDRQTGLTHTARGITDEGWFYLQTGGWTFRQATKDRYAQLPPQSPDVRYLRPDDMAFLKTVPSEIHDVSIQRRSKENLLQGTFRIRNLGEAPKVTIYWGTAEALTFTDRWQNKLNIGAPREGTNSFKIDDVPSGESVFIRVLLQNDEGQYWSPETMKVDTGDETSSISAPSNPATN